MTQKNNETLILLLAILITIGFIFGGVWFLMERWVQLQRGDTSTAMTNLGTTNSNQPKINCSNLNLPAGTFTYGGSTTWAPIRGNVDSILTSSCPQFNLSYMQPVNQKPGSGTGIAMLIDNQLDFSQSSRSVKGEENQQAQAKGFSLKEIPVAIDGIAVAVHPTLNIPGLTVAQLKDIYTGKITNWQEVGGQNLSITPYSRTKAAGGTVEFFIENVLNKEDFGSNVQYVNTTTDALRKLGSNVGGIYFASAPEVVPQCTIKPIAMARSGNQFVPPYQGNLVSASQCPSVRNQLNADAFRSGDYPITRRLFVIVKQNGQTDQKAGEAYANWLLTPQGQELIQSTGFVKLK